MNTFFVRDVDNRFVNVDTGEVVDYDIVRKHNGMIVTEEEMRLYYLFTANRPYYPVWFTCHDCKYKSHVGNFYLHYGRLVFICSECLQ